MKTTEFRSSISEFLSGSGAEIDEVHDGWNAVACPFHHDTHSSASFNEDEGVFKCFGCGVQGDAVAVLMHTQECTVEQARATLEAMGVARKPVKRQEKHTVRRSDPSRAMLQDALERYERDIDQISGYLSARGITRTAAKAARLGFVSDPAPGHEQYRGRLCIPYMTTSGAVDMKFRCTQSHVCKDHGHSKYLCLPGSDSRMYMAMAVLTSKSYIAITEGELDAVTLNFMCGIPAVGVPGANNWKSHYARVLEGFDRVFVLGDGDTAGREFTRNVGKKVAGAVCIDLPEGNDVNDVFQHGGAAAVMNLLGV